MPIGLLSVEFHVPTALSLKEKRSVVNSLKDRIRGRFNVSVAELDPNETWQRAAVGIVTIGHDRSTVDGCLRQVAEWMRRDPAIALIRIDQELL